MNSGKFGKTCTVAICTDKIDLKTKNRYCSDQILGMNNFPEFDDNFPETKELKNSVNLRIKGT